MIKPFKKCIVGIIRLLTRVYRTKSDLIVIERRGYSGSNVSPLIEAVYEGKLTPYRIRVVSGGKTLETSLIRKFKSIWYKCKSLNQAKLVVTTHGPIKVKRKSINLDLWHGFPLKGMNLMDRGEKKKASINRIDYSVSLSQTYSTLLNSCFGTDGNKFIITGYPRNDYLFTSHGKKILQDILEIDLSEKKILLFMPTYRQTQETNKKDGAKSGENFFGFASFKPEKFNSFLEENGLFFLFKLHPNEEEIFKESFSSNLSNIQLLLGSTLAKHETDLYKIVNASDMLITDYSSIYFDYLLLDKPIIFTTPDLSSYEDNRGFLVSPLSFWMPGPICFTYDELKQSIKQQMLKDTYREKRKMVKQLVHDFTDEESTTRVIKLIHELMNNSMD